VPQGESAYNWSKWLSLQFVKGKKRTPLEYLNVFQAQQTTQCPGTQFEIIEQKKDSVTYRFNSPACMDHDRQSQIARLFEGSEGLYKLTYAEKTAELSEATMNECLALFDKSHVTKHKSPE